MMTSMLDTDSRQVNLELSEAKIRQDVKNYASHSAYDERSRNERARIQQEYGIKAIPEILKIVESDDMSPFQGMVLLSGIVEEPKLYQAFKSLVLMPRTYKDPDRSAVDRGLDSMCELSTDKDEFKTDMEQIKELFRSTVISKRLPDLLSHIDYLLTNYDSMQRINYGLKNERQESQKIFEVGYANYLKSLRGEYGNNELLNEVRDEHKADTEDEKEENTSTFSRGRFKIIHEPRGKLEFLDSVGEIITVSTVMSDWSDFNQFLYENESMVENPYNLIDGTANLIEQVIIRAKSGSPVDTLVFLDKSARPGAYLFNQLWHQLISQSTETGGVNKPKIKFLNVGYDDPNKHDHKKSLEELGVLYNRGDLSGNVIIVDEYIASGSSSRLAGEAIQKAGYRMNNLEAIQMFYECPSWYSDSSVKGVSEVPHMSPEDRKKIDSMPEKLKSSIADIKKAIGIRGLIVSLTDDEKYVLDYIESHASYVANLAQAGININKTKRELNDYCKKMRLDVFRVTSFIATQGGYTALPPLSQDLPRIQSFKRKLKKIVTESVKRGLVKYNSV